MCSRCERHVRDLHHLPLLDVFLANIFDNVKNHRWNELVGFARTFERGDLPVFVVLEVAIGQISVIFRVFFFID